MNYANEYLRHVSTSVGLQCLDETESVIYRTAFTDSELLNVFLCSFFYINLLLLVIVSCSRLNSLPVGF